jgi:ATP-dependent DNA ligase
MEARLVNELPRGSGWQFEPKWDGFRCLAFRDGADVDLRAKSGKPLARYFPEMVELMRKLPAKRFVVDGELTVATNGSLSFDALQMRLHPAESRIRKLARETPATFIVFDCLATPRGSVMAAPLKERRAALEALLRKFDREGLKLSPFTREREAAKRWLKATGASLDGVIAKPLDEPYIPGERIMLKVKRLRTADCVVGGFRYLQDRPEVGSLLLGLYDDEGKFNHVGFTSTITDEERGNLTKRLEKLVKPPGFTGDAPGGPSRWSNERSAAWSPLKPKLVVEVRYDHVTGERFRHGTKLVRWRPDKAPRQCTFEQMQDEARPEKRVAGILER